MYTELKQKTQSVDAIIERQKRLENLNKALRERQGSRCGFRVPKSAIIMNIQTSYNGGVDTASTVDNLSPMQFNRRATVQIVEK